MTRHEHRKRRKSCTVRDKFLNNREHLRIGNYQLWRGNKRSQQPGQFLGSAAQRNTMLVKQIAKRLHLRLYKTSLGGRCILRHHKHHNITRPCKQMCNVINILIQSITHGNTFKQCLTSFTGNGRERNNLAAKHATPRIGACLTPLLVALTGNSHKRQFKLLYTRQPLLLKHRVTCSIPKQKNGSIGTRKHLAGCIHTHCSKPALIVKACSVGNHCSPYARQFNILPHRVSSSTGHIGDN